MSTQTIYFDNPQTIVNLQSQTNQVQADGYSMSGAITTNTSQITTLQSTTTSMSGSVYIQTNTTNVWTAEKNKTYQWNLATLSGTFGGTVATVTLPSPATSGDYVTLIDGNGNWGQQRYNGSGAQVGPLVIAPQGFTGVVDGTLFKYRSGKVTYLFNGTNWIGKTEEQVPNLVIGNTQIPDPSDLYALRNMGSLDNQTNGNLAVQNTLIVGDACECTNLVSRAQLISDVNPEIQLRGGLNVEPGANQIQAIGLDGGFYYPNIYGGDEFRTQIFYTSTGPYSITRKVLPKLQRPIYSTSGCKNTIIAINDGMGKNMLWTSKVVADTLLKYQIMNYAMSGSSQNWFLLGTTQGTGSYGVNSEGSAIRPSNFNEFTLCWEKPGNYDCKIEYDPVCTEMYNPLFRVTKNRNEMIEERNPNGIGAYIIAEDPVGIPVGAYYIADSAATSSGFATNRLTQRENVNTASSQLTQVANLPSNLNISVPPFSQGETTYASFRTIMEIAKAQGKSIGVIATSDALHATPAGFVSKSNDRNIYAQLIRQCFGTGPNAVRPNLIMGGAIGSGNDRLSSALTAPNGQRVYPFPEINSSWASLPTGSTGSIAPLNLTTAQLQGQYASSVQYAQKYGYSVYDGASNMSSLNIKLTPNVGESTGAFIQRCLDQKNYIYIDTVTLTNTPRAAWKTPIGTSVTTTSRVVGIFGLYEPFIRDTTAPTSLRPTQNEMLNKAIEMLSVNPNGFVLMYENSQADWSGHEGMPLTAGLEILEGSTALQKQIFNPSNPNNLSLTGTHLVITPDHECGGWTYADGNGNIDFTDNFNDGHFQQLKNYENERGVSLATNFMGMHVNFGVTSMYAITGGYTGAYSTGTDGSTYPGLENYYRAITLSTGPDEGTFINNYKTWAVNNLFSLNTGAFENRIGWVFNSQNQFTGTYTNAGRIYIDRNNNRLILQSPLYTGSNGLMGSIKQAPTGTANTVNNWFTPGTGFFKVILPVSLFGRYAKANNIDITQDLTVILQNRAATGQLFSLNTFGQINDPDWYRDVLMSQYVANGNGSPYWNISTNFLQTSRFSLHASDLANLCTYQTGASNIQVFGSYAPVWNASLDASVEGYRKCGYYHTSSTCSTWVKSGVFNNFEPILGMNMNQFLNGKSVTTPTLGKIIDGSI